MKVCVVGAGPSGLVTIKELLEEGHEPVCFEKSNAIGGVFHCENGKVYDSTLLTVSNYFMAFSSFPPTKDDPRDFWTHERYFEYLENFCDHFSLQPHIQFNSEIRNIKRLSGGGFAVTVASADEVSETLFDAVAICTGTHQIPKRPQFKGEQDFRGEILHSATYRNAQPFAGKRVLCFGIGETAADVAHEIANVADACMLSIRRYQSIVERFPGGGPHTSDAYTSRLLSSISSRRLHDISCNSARNKLQRECSEYDRVLATWTLNCQSPKEQFLTKNEIFVQDIASGKLDVHCGQIEALQRDQVVFEDGSTFKADVVMCCTGYQDRFDFLEDYEIPDVRQLYKHMFHPEVGSRLALIGWARPSVGGIPACSEMQSRYFALLCSGKRQLPGKARLQSLIAREASQEEDSFRLSYTIRTLVDYVGYMSSLAGLIGCRPSKLLLLSDPKLLERYWFGSLVSNHFRLSGPGKQTEMARDVIMRLPIGWSRKDIRRYSVEGVLSYLEEIFERIPLLSKGRTNGHYGRTH